MRGFEDQGQGLHRRSSFPFPPYLFVRESTPSSEEVTFDLLPRVVPAAGRVRQRLCYKEQALLRKVLCAAVCLGLCVGITLADEFGAIITKVEGNKVTFSKAKFDPDTKKFEKSDPMTLPTADNVKVVQGKFNKDTKKTEACALVEGGLKNKTFTEMPEKGLFATIVTDDGNKKITEIRASQFGKKKKDQ